MLEAERLVRIINEHDVPHRKGWKPSDYPGRAITGDHLVDEAKELRDALLDYQAEVDLSHMAVRDECGDVLACLLQIAHRFGLTIEDLDRAACRKMRMRFTTLPKIEQLVPLIPAIAERLSNAFEIDPAICIGTVRRDFKDGIVEIECTEGEFKGKLITARVFPEGSTYPDLVGRKVGMG